MPSDVKHWASKFKSATDSGATIAAMGKYYTCTFMYDMGDAKVIGEMHDGKVKAINTHPAPLDAYDFALRASPPSWREVRPAGPASTFPWHLGRELPRGPEDRRQCPRADAEFEEFHR